LQGCAMCWVQKGVFEQLYRVSLAKDLRKLGLHTWHVVSSFLDIRITHLPGASLRNHGHQVFSCLMHWQRIDGWCLFQK
jgi:hypothetical protein